jgi:hypothetical protein
MSILLWTHCVNVEREADVHEDRSAADKQPFVSTNSRDSCAAGESLQRERERKGRASADLTVDPDPPAVELDKLA